MRKYAYIKEPYPCNKKDTVYKIMLHKTCGGYELYYYCSPDAVQCSYDRFYDSLEDLYEDWNGKIDDRGWIDLNDPLPGCSPSAFTDYIWHKGEMPEDLPVRQVYGIAYAADGRILLRIDKGKYKLTGGRPESGETFEETLRREYLEEVNVELENIMYLGYLEVSDINDRYAQVRMTARIKAINKNHIDPDTGRMYERRLVEAGEVKKYLGYPDKGGNQMIDDAVRVTEDILAKQRMLEKWDVGNPYIEKCLKESPERPVFRINSDTGRYVLKGFSDETPEATIGSNVQAHLFLGNEKGMAPAIFRTKAGEDYIREQGYWYYLMEFIEGRQMEETPDDEFLLGQAARKLHALEGYRLKTPFTQSKERYYEWFRDKEFVKEFDAILDAIPDFRELDQCFVHTDMGPHNAMLDKNGRVVWIDLDDSGIGSRFLDLGWPFIMQYVDFHHDTEEMNYRFDLAVSFLRGYYGKDGITRREFDLVFFGAEQMHISYMQTYGPYAVDSLWKILKFGMDQKETLWNRIKEAVW